MVTPTGAAPDHRRRTLPNLPARALSALVIGGILAIGAASVWYMLGRADLPGLIAGSDDAWTGMTTDEYLAVLRESQPVIRSDFDVYLVEHRRYASLVYVKERCALADVDARFFVHVSPASLDALSEGRKPHGFDNLDFEFEQYGARRGETCWVDLPLPGYDIAEIRTGQYVMEEEGVFREIWQGRTVFQVDETQVDETPMAEYPAGLGEIQPAIRSDFDVYLFEDRLVYVKERCALADVDARFFVHVSPVSPDALSEGRKPHGFDNLDFGFEQYGARRGETCWVDLPLPGYDIAEIRTGQYVMEEEGVFRKIWQGRTVFQVDEAPVDEAPMAEYPAALGESQPAIRSDFDVYLFEDRLVYVKERCARDDVVAKFFVEVTPVSPDALPEDRKLHGIDNLGFWWERHGARRGETCWAAFPLPGYEIAEIRTGQYVKKEEGGYRNIWVGRFLPALAGNPGARPFGGIQDISEGRVPLDVQVHRMTTDEYLAALRESRPAIRSDFDMYLVVNQRYTSLIYVKEQCTWDDVDGRFFVEVAPVSPDALPEDRKLHGFEDFDFRFEQFGARHGEMCWAEFPLPGYEIAGIRTGQYVEEEEGVFRNIWKERAVFQVDGTPVDEYLAALRESRPAIRSDFDVHLAEDRLIYVKERCARDDVAARFFVEVAPVSPDALPEDRKPHGIDNLGFWWERHGARHGETCWAAFPLPGYEVAAIRTGQYVEEEGGYRSIWQGRIHLE